jgi:hypothetical protein
MYRTSEVLYSEYSHSDILGLGRVISEKPCSYASLFLPGGGGEGWGGGGKGEILYLIQIYDLPVFVNEKKAK